MSLSRVLFFGTSAVALSLVACSSEQSQVTDAYPSTARTASSSSDVRKELAGAVASRAPGDAGYRREVDAWVARLSDDAICAASRRASAEHVVFTVGVDLAASARREIVFDLRARRVAVFTKAAGDLKVDREHLFASSSDVAMPEDDEPSGARVAILSPDSARSHHALIGPDRSPYGESYAVSEAATRAFEASKITGRNADMATKIVRWSPPGDALAMKAALLAVVSGKDLSATCRAEGGVKTNALRPRADGDAFDFEGMFDETTADWLTGAPTSTTTIDEELFDTSAIASCATDPALACSGEQVCTNAGEAFCCAEPRPVTKPCSGESSCGEGESCVLASNEPDAEGNILTCVESSGGACAAIGGAQQTTRSVSLKYEGTCEFLRSCSTWSRNLPAGQVRWGCEGVAECSDSDRWVAGPSRSYCGKTVQFCKGGSCTTAKVRDVSVSRDWEGSNGVMDALDLPHGLRGQCSGFGGGKVTVKVL